MRVCWLGGVGFEHFVVDIVVFFEIGFFRRAEGGESLYFFTGASIYYPVSQSQEGEIPREFNRNFGNSRQSM